MTLQDAQQRRPMRGRVESQAGIRHQCLGHDRATSLLVAVLLLTSAGALWYAADEPCRQVQLADYRQ